VILCGSDAVVTLPSGVDMAAITDACGDLSVVNVNVAAGLDGTPKDPQAKPVRGR
jgi:hypothetical protein